MKFNNLNQFIRTSEGVLYDSSKPQHPDYGREDITHIGIPLMALCNAEFPAARQDRKDSHYYSDF